MRHMELKSAFTMAFLLALLVLQAHQGGSSHVVDLSSDVYEIDYRGPETHSFVPPPDQSGGGGPRIHHETVMAQHKFRDPRAHNFGDKGKTIHG